MFVVVLFGMLCVLVRRTKSQPNVVKSILGAVIALFATAAVVTELFGKGALNKSPLVIFFVVDADTSTIAISSALSAVVRLGSWLILGIILLLNGVSNDILIIAIQVDYSDVC